MKLILITLGTVVLLGICAFVLAIIPPVPPKAPIPLPHSESHPAMIVPGTPSSVAKPRPTPSATYQPKSGTVSCQGYADGESIEFDCK